MNQKLVDYEKTLAVIRSCVTNAQNQVAHRMCWNFYNLHKDDYYSRQLFIQCDNVLMDIVQGRRR